MDGISDRPVSIPLGRNVESPTVWDGAEKEEEEDGKVGWLSGCSTEKNPLLPRMFYGKTKTNPARIYPPEQ